MDVMATLPKTVVPSENQYVTLLEVSQAIANHKSLPELLQDLARRLHTVLNFTYLSLILHDSVEDVMRLHTLHSEAKSTFQPGAAFSMKQQTVEGDYAYILWTAETADNLYEVGTDTFVVRDGKIVAQSFAGKITPKS